MNDTIELTIGELTIKGLRLGDPNGPPLLALHGWLDNAASFLPLSPYLQDFNLIAIDLPGHGLSSHLAADNPYHFIDAIVHVSDVLDALAWPTFNILGHSMGGGIATLLAGTWPERVEKIAVIEGLGPLSAPAESAPNQTREFIISNKKITRRRKHYYDSVEAAANMRAKKGYVTLACARILAERGTQLTDKGYIWRHDPKLYLPSPVRLTEQQVQSFIGNITAPLCFITADMGFQYDDDKMAGRRSHVQTLREVELPGGHHVHMETPENVAAVLKDFFCDK